MDKVRPAQALWFESLRKHVHTLCDSATYRIMTVVCRDPMTFVGLASEICLGQLWPGCRRFISLKSECVVCVEWPSLDISIELANGRGCMAYTGAYQYAIRTRCVWKSLPSRQHFWVAWSLRVIALCSRRRFLRVIFAAMKWFAGSGSSSLRMSRLGKW